MAVFYNLKNNAKSTLAAGIGVGATSITVADPLLFPNTAAFLVTIWDSVNFPDPTDDPNTEILKVTNVVGAVFTVERAQEDTLDVAHSGGHTVAMLFTAGTLVEVEDAFNYHDTSTTGVHGIESGDQIVGKNYVDSQISGENHWDLTSGSDSLKPHLPVDVDLVNGNLITNGLVDGVDVSAHDVAITNVHGIVSPDTIAGISDITNHAAETTGVHGAGSGDRVALMSDITAENFWDRTATTLSPHNANDNLDLGSGNILTSGTVDGVDVSAHAAATPATPVHGINTTDLLPSQTGNNGKYLTTNGTTPSWDAIDVPGFVTQAFAGETSINVAHNFGAYPVVNVVDDTNSVLVPLSIVHNTINDFTVTFSSAKSGWIVATGGSTTSTRETSFGITLDGSGSTITTGAKGYTILPFNGTISSWQMVADQAGDIVIDVKKGDFPAAGATPTTASIIGSGGTQPTLSGVASGSDSTLTGWTTSITAGQVIEWEVVSCTTITRVNLIIKCSIPVQAVESTAFGITIDGSSSEITDGSKGYAIMPFDCAITGWKVIGDVSGSVVVDVKKGTFPAGGAAPTTASLITSGTKPTITGAFSASSTDVTGWTTAIAEGDVIEWNIDSCTTITRLNLILTCNKT